MPNPDIPYRDILDSLPVMVLRWQPDTTVNFANLPYAAVYGHNAESLPGKRLLELIPASRLAEAEADFQAILVALTPRSVCHENESCLLIANTERCFAWLHLGLFDQAGQLIEVQSIGRDITERKRAAQVFAENQAQWQHIISSAAEGFWMIDRDRRTIDVNATLCNMLGYSRKEMLGRTPLEFADADNQAIFRAQMSQIGATYQRDYEITLTRKDGTALPTFFHATTHRDAAGAVEMAFAFVTDLTEQKRAEYALKASEARYRRIVETANEGIWEMDRDHITTFVNPIMANYLGFQPEDMIGRPVEDFMFPEDLPEHQLRMRERGKGRGGAYEYRFRTARGEERWMHVSATALLDADQGFAGAFAMFQDITDRRQAEEQLRQAAAVFENTVEGVIITDPEARIVAVNQAFTQITGYEETEVLGNNPSLIGSGRHDSTFYQAMWRDLVSQGNWRGEIWNRRKNGEIYPEWLTISVVRDDQGKPAHYVGVFSDITSIKQSELELNRLAYHDALTGLPNRLLLLDRIDHAIQRAGRASSQIAILFIDLDRFKNVNDNLGHHIGDALLIAIAERIRTRLRAEDTLARLGGDEFVLLMEDLDSALDGAQQAAQLARDLCTLLAQPFNIAGHELFHSASVGISLFPQDGEDVQTLLKHADIAMYRAKDAGRNGYQFYIRELSNAALQRFSLEAALHKALERREFELHYQPQVEMASGRVVAMEALIRWRHPEKGMISPDLFISLAEETGLILPIGAWVLETACRDILACQALCGSQLTVAVNLSVTELERGNPVERVAQVLAETKLLPSCLELEITESSAMRRGEESLSVLHELAALGVHLSIDDFGSGYSNLGYLKRLPVSSLKIDRLFVRDLPDNPEDATITRAILSLAHALGLKVVAEGVETPVQREFLMQNDCDVMQGFLISRPLPFNDIVQLIQGLQKR